MLQGRQHGAAQIHPAPERRPAVRGRARHQAREAARASVRDADSVHAPHAGRRPEDPRDRRRARADGARQVLVRRRHVPRRRVRVADSRRARAHAALQRVDGGRAPSASWRPRARDRRGHRQPDVAVHPARVLRRVGHQPALPAVSALLRDRQAVSARAQGRRPGGGGFRGARGPGGHRRRAQRDRARAASRRRDAQSVDGARARRPRGDPRAAASGALRHARHGARPLPAVHARGTARADDVGGVRDRRRCSTSTASRCPHGGSTGAS